MRALLQRIARRCPTHDRPSYPRIRELEHALGLPPTTGPESVADQYADPTIVDCGHAWCSSRRR